MKKKLTLKTNFARVMAGQAERRGSVTMFIASGKGKVGFAVGKKVKGAVKRNRVKRLLREYARHNGLPIRGKDVVLMGSVDLL